MSAYYEDPISVKTLPLTEYSKVPVFADMERGEVMTASLGVYSNLSTWLRSHVLVTSLIIFFCSVCPRVFLTWRADPVDLLRSIPDAGTYLAPAQSLIEQGTFLDSQGKPAITRTPGYPALLATLMLLVGCDLHNVLIVQTIILSLSVLVLYWLARRILPPVMAFTGSLIAAFSPWGAALAGLPLSDGTFLLLLVSLFFILKLIQEVNTPIPLVLGALCVGMLTAALVLVRPVWPLVILIAGALLFCCGLRRKGVWLSLAIMLVCAVVPLSLWQARNQHEAYFDGLSDISGITAWRYLASRVTAQAHGIDRHTLAKATLLDDQSWQLSVQEADQERWRRAKAVFRNYPILTIYSFTLSAAEHMIHPSPDVLTPARLNFSGDFVILALLWGGLLILACIGWWCAPDPKGDDGITDRNWLSMMLLVCLLLTLSSGISFGQGSRLRAPLELIVPLLAGIGLVRTIRAFQQISMQNAKSVR